MTNNEMISSALTAFDMPDARYELIRQNENITCRVDYDGAVYAMRIHSSAEGFNTSLAAGSQSDFELFETETALLLYMSKNGFEDLQKPIPCPSGGYVAHLENDVPAMLITWVEGKPLTKENGDKYAHEASRLACRIYNAAKGFTGERLHYDNALCDRMIAEIHNAVSLNHITEDAGKICVKELNAVKESMLRQENIYAPSIIHADLGFGNILLTENGLVPIDFSLSGYGYPAHEAGQLMSNYQNDDVIAEILAGFTDSGITIDKTDTDIFNSYSILLFICAQHGRFYRDDWFASAMTRWCTTSFIH